MSNIGAASNPNVAYDQWGLTQIPTNAPKFSPIFDGWGKPQLIPSTEQALAVILDFLGCWLVTDGNVSAAWQTVAGSAGGRAVKSLYLHDPSKVVFIESALPALYMWREGGKQQWDTDDWLRDYSSIKALWVYPTALQEKQRIRVPFAPVLEKSIGAGIERGRTPSWRQSGDPDKAAALQGSLFYTFAGFDSFELIDWRAAKITIEGAEKRGGAGYENYPAVEFRFEMVELLVEGLLRSPPYYTLLGIDQTVQIQAPVSYSLWAGNTLYPQNAIILPLSTSALYYFASSPNGGRSGVSPPTFPTTPGSSVVDGTVTWTCVGPLNGVAIEGPLDGPIPPGTNPSL